MRVWLNKNDNGDVCTFEVPNWKLGRVRATKIVASIPGSSILRKPLRFLSFFREEEFCEFTLNGIHFGIEEPFGDNSRFHIYRKGVVAQAHCPEINILISAFKSAW